MIRLAQESDIHEILPLVRAQEGTTIARLGVDPLPMLLRALGPFAYTGLANGRVACMWGLAFDVSVGHYPRLWLLTTPLVEENKIKFLRESQRFVRWAREEFGTIEGCVDCENIVSRRWLEWLGFLPVESLGGYMRMRNGH